MAVIVTVAGFAAGRLDFPPVMQAYLMDSFPTDSMAGDIGAMRSVYVGFEAIGPLYVGVLADAFDYAIGFTGLVCGLTRSGSPGSSAVSSSAVSSSFRAGPYG